MREDLFDFGFSDIEELVKDEKEKLRKMQVGYINKLNNNGLKAQRIYDAILPLLDNLRKEPTKDYIFWPDRIKKVDAFEELLTQILNEDD